MVERYSDAKESNNIVWKYRRPELLVILAAKSLLMKGRIVLWALLVLSTLQACSIRSSETKPGETEPPAVNELPDMTITLLNGSTVDVKKLEGSPILIFFQPECDHCQHAAAAISNNLAAFHDRELYFITSQTLATADKFAKDYKLVGYSNVHFSWTPTENVLKNFGPISAPSVYIYSNDHKLIKSFRGDVRIEEVLKYI
jgi:peroxiredoxin